jgi:hypothetical protein
VYCVIYSLDATRCIILQLAATQSLHHALGAAAPAMWQCGLVVLLLAGLLSQVRRLLTKLCLLTKFCLTAAVSLTMPFHQDQLARYSKIASLLQQVNGFCQRSP